MLSGTQWVDFELALVNAFLGVWQSILIYIPLILVAVIVFVLGWIVARGLQEVGERIVTWTRLDKLLAKKGLKPFLDRAGFRLHSGRFLGMFVKWFVVLATLMTTADILQLNAVSLAISSLLAYLPNVIAAAVILVLTILFANFLQKVVRGTIAGANIKAGSFVAAVVKWAVFIIGFLTALEQLRIQTTVLSGTFGTVLVGLVFMVAIAGGLAFGLAGKDFAHDLLAKLRNEIEDR